MSDYLVRPDGTLFDSTTKGLTGLVGIDGTEQYITVRVRRSIFTSRPLTPLDSGNVLEVAGSASMALGSSMGIDFSCVVDVVSGTLTITPSGGVTINGSTNPVTRAAPQALAIMQRITGAPNAYTITGT